jgi:nitroreductase
MDINPTWLPDAAEFPSAGSDSDRLRSLVRFAVLAPSDRNTQPWIFHVEGDALELLADRSRALPVGDPEGRTLTISCGAALFHLRLAARHYGFDAAVERLPEAGRPDLLARVRLQPGGEPTTGEENLFDAIPERRTNRRDFRTGFVPPYLVEALTEAASAEGAWISFETEAGGKETIADLIAEGDHLRMANPALREERASWMHRAADDVRDGLPGYALGVASPLDLATGLLAAAYRHDEDGRTEAYRDVDRATGPGVLATLGTDGDTPAYWLRAGEALARVLLRATAAGLSASFLNAPVEVPALRERLARAAGRQGWPQILIRLGYGPDTPPTPRRPADEVTR